MLLQQSKTFKLPNIFTSTSYTHLLLSEYLLNSTIKLKAFISAFNLAYLLSFIKFQIKKEINETAKDTAPKVSSLGQGAKWVS